MPPASGRATHAAYGDRRAEFVAVVERVLPELGDRVEGLALYALVCVFWGVVLYVAMTTAL
jgi:hypothetical protein